MIYGTVETKGWVWTGSKTERRNISCRKESLKIIGSPSKPKVSDIILINKTLHSEILHMNQNWNQADPELYTERNGSYTKL